ncbi:MAG: hypothetical protein NVS2B12_39020 [Ktedonobacteraceae bacterium]
MATLLLPLPAGNAVARHQVQQRQFHDNSQTLNKSVSMAFWTGR